MASAKYAEYKGYFDNGKWSKDMVHMATERGALTEAEYLEITKEEYVPIIYKWDGGNLTELSSKRLITGDPAASSNQSSGDSEPGDSSDTGGSGDEPTSDEPTSDEPDTNDSGN